MYDDMIDISNMNENVYYNMDDSIFYNQDVRENEFIYENKMFSTTKKKKRVLIKDTLDNFKNYNNLIPKSAIVNLNYDADNEDNFIECNCDCKCHYSCNNIVKNNFNNDDLKDDIFLYKNPLHKK